MHLYWYHLWNSRRYRRATALGRLMLELRFSLAHALRAKRKLLKLTQRDLATLINSTQSTVSRMERPFTRVSMDQIVYALAALGADDREIAEAFYAEGRIDVRRLRRRAAEPFYPRPVLFAAGLHPNVKHELFRMVHGTQPHAKKQQRRGLVRNAESDRDSMQERQYTEQVLPADYEE